MFKKDKNQEDRFNFMKSMQEIVLSFDDETPYFDHWIWLVPDEASDNDLADIASDPEFFDEVVRCFVRLIKSYGNTGFYIGGRVYGCKEEGAEKNV